jgi:hypothetical protein
MTKRAIMISLCTILMCVLVGFGTFKTVKEAMINGDVKYDILSINDLKNNLLLPDTKTAINIINDERGIFHFDDGKNLIVLVSAGSKQPTNNKIEIKSISTSNNGQAFKLEVTESENPSQNNASEASYILIRIKGYRSTKEIYCVSQDNKKFGKISYFSNPPRTKE